MNRLRDIKQYQTNADGPPASIADEVDDKKTDRFKTKLDTEPDDFIDLS